MVGRKIPREDLFFLSRVLSFPLFLFFLYGPQVDPFFYSLFFLSACRMIRGHEEVLTSQARRRRGTPQKTPTTSSLVAVMSTKELRLYSQIPSKIRLETSDGVATSTFGEVDNVIYFTQEQFAARLRLLVLSLVK